MFVFRSRLLSPLVSVTTRVRVYTRSTTVHVPLPLVDVQIRTTVPTPGPRYRFYLTSSWTPHRTPTECRIWTYQRPLSTPDRHPRTSGHVRSRRLPDSTPTRMSKLISSLNTHVRVTTLSPSYKVREPSIFDVPQATRTRPITKGVTTSRVTSFYDSRHCHW